MFLRYLVPWPLAIHWHSRKSEIVPGEPLRPPSEELNTTVTTGVAKYSDFWSIEGYISRKRCKIGCRPKLVLITNRKSHMSFRLDDWYQNTSDIALDGNPAPRLRKKGGRTAPNFSAHVCCGQTAGSWMDQDVSWYGGRPRPRRHCVRWGPSSPFFREDPILGAWIYLNNGLTDRHELKFGKVTPIDPLDLYALNISEFYKSMMAATANLEKMRPDRK